MHERQVLEVVWHVTQGETHTLQVPELLKKPVKQLDKHSEPLRTKPDTQLEQVAVELLIQLKHGDVHCTHTFDWLK